MKGRKTKAKENKVQERKIWIKYFKWEYLQVTGCMCDFLAGKWMHLVGSLIVIGMGFAKCHIGFSLSFRFLHRCGSFIWLEFGLMDSFGRR